MSNTPELLQNDQERGIESPSDAADKQLEKLSNSPENASELLSPRDAEARTEKARKEALRAAVSTEAGGKEKESTSLHKQTQRRGAINKKQLDKSYKQTMKQVQNELSPASKAFSKIIHNKVIEKTSDIVGDTIARPNAMLSGSVAAFVLTLAVYTIAKTVGFQLSGFETILSFIIGWLAGVTYDYLHVLFTGKKY